MTSKTSKTTDGSTDGSRTKTTDKAKKTAKLEWGKITEYPSDSGRGKTDIHKKNVKDSVNSFCDAYGSKVFKPGTKEVVSGKPPRYDCMCMGVGLCDYKWHKISVGWIAGCNQRRATASAYHGLSRMKRVSVPSSTFGVTQQGIAVGEDI